MANSILWKMQFGFTAIHNKSQGKKPAIRNTIKVDFVSLLEINNLETCISF